MGLIFDKIEALDKYAIFNLKPPNQPCLGRAGLTEEFFAKEPNEFFAPS